MHMPKITNQILQYLFTNSTHRPVRSPCNPARPEGAVNDACWVWLTRSAICQAAYKKEDALMLPDTAGSETLSASMCNMNMLAILALIDPY